MPNTNRINIWGNWVDVPYQGSDQTTEQNYQAVFGRPMPVPNPAPAGGNVVNWRTTPGTQASTPAPGAWNAGDDWNMNAAPADVVAAMNQYAATHDEKYYQSQIPTPAGGGDIALPGGSTWNESVWNAGGPMSSGLEYWETHPEFQREAASYAAGAAGGGAPGMFSMGGDPNDWGGLFGSPRGMTSPPPGWKPGMSLYTSPAGGGQGAGAGVPGWQTTPGTQAPTPAPGAWNAGDVWDMNRAPADVLASMKQYGLTHDDKYYQSQIPTPAGGQLVPPAPVTPPAITPSVTTPTTPITPAAVTPPGTSELNKNLLVTPPAATAGQNALTALQMLLGRGATGGLGTYKFPDLVKQTQQRWGGFSPAAFSKP